NAILINGEADNKFDNGDYILFYGIGTTEWKKNKNNSGSCLLFSHQVNYYSDTSYYYITTDMGAGKRIQTVPSITSRDTSTTNTYDYYDFHEQNNINFIKSGS